ncbi:MAG: hypothetical protein U0625_07045 [Phycisphaerales bacterium]
MKHPKVYSLSRKHGPPKVDLRQAEILNAWGDNRWAKLAVAHKLPEDVTREQIAFYGWVYSFMEPTDLLFYLYPIAREFDADNSLHCIDSFLYSLDRHAPDLMSQLVREDREALREGLRWIWNSGGSEFADWEACPNLRKVMGLE